MKIEVSLKISGISAEGHTQAKQQAFEQLRFEDEHSTIFSCLGILDYDDFAKLAKSYREADGTFTVVIP